MTKKKIIKKKWSNHRLNLVAHLTRTMHDENFWKCASFPLDFCLTFQGF